MSNPAAPKTGTAADLLHFDIINHVTKNCEALTRVSTANETWMVKDWDGEVYAIKFDSNFSKKHLYTFSKKTDNTAQKAAQLSATSGKTDAENWHDAEEELLKGKIAKALDKRAVANVCACGHLFNQHPPPNRTTCNGAGCGCTGYATPYGIARKYVGKPTYDPYAGMPTPKNTCIILNWVPKTEFEDVVVKSIQALEKPAGWVVGQPLAVAVGDAACLKWDFGPARKGVVLVATKVGANVTYAPPFQGCWVSAKKTASEFGKQTWQIYHMETGHNNPGNAHHTHRPF
jgi:hypothetical protein